jgi:hypothetical protein
MKLQGVHGNNHAMRPWLSIKEYTSLYPIWEKEKLFSQRISKLD